MASKPSLQELAAENQGLRARLERAEESLREIMSGEADVLFVAGTDGAQLFALKDANQSYRILIENMSEGALTLTPTGLILYANRRFAEMLGAPLEKVIGSEIYLWFPLESRQAVQALLQKDADDKRREEFVLASARGTRVQVYLSVSRFVLNESDSVCMIVTDLTEQKRNAVILAAEKLSNAILEQAGDAIIICDKAGRIIRASKQAQALFGKSPLGLLFERAFPLRKLDGSAFSGIGTLGMNLRILEEARLECNGQEFDFLMSVGHLKDARNELLGSVVTLTDITKLKTAELALQKNKAQLSEAIAIAKIGYWEYEFATDEFLFNDQYYWLHKITAEAAGGYRMSSVDFAARYVYPEDAAMVGKNIQLAFESRDPEYFAKVETRLLSGDGDVFWVEVRFRIQKDLQGKTIRLIGVNQDITDRKHAELKLLESERRFTDLLGNVELVSVMHDREGRITYCNDYLLHLTGWKNEEVIGRNWIELFVPPESVDLNKRVFAELLLNNPEARHYESEILTRSGEHRLVRWSNSVLRSDSGEVSGIASIGDDITERRRVERSVARLQSQRELILESLDEGIYGMDLEGKITFQNSAAARMLGYHSEELIGRTAHTAIHYARRDGTPFPIAECPIHITLADGVVRRVEDDAFWRKDGVSILVEYTAAPKRNEQGAIVGCVVAFRDISERKQREQEILATKNQLQATLDAIPDLLFEVGLDGRYYAYHSPRVDLLAAPPEDLLGKTVAETLPADAAEIVLAALREADATGRSAGKQFELALPLGLFQFELSVSRMPVAVGREVRFICLSRDITERKRAELELRESERVVTVSRADAAAVRDIAARLQAILDTVVDGVITIDEFGKVETFNPAAERIFGYAADDVLGRNIRMLMPEPYHDQHDGYLARYRSTGEARIIGTGREVSGLRKDGGTFPLDLAVSEMMLGGERHYTGVVRDITERKAAEQAVVDAKIEAERANAAKNTFLATMSHEIRTPMNGVIGMIEVLQQSNLSGPQIEMSNTIRESAYVLLAVINDILDFSKIEAGKLEIDHIPMCVAEVVEKTCEILDRMAQKNGVELTLFTDPAIPEQVMGDPGRLRQILINLANNAIKFSGGNERSGRVSIRVLLADKTREHVILDFKVADNGIGIDEATRARLFSPFVQADVSTTRNYGGTGLGLAISRQLVSMMNGDIAVHSDLGKGALFSVRIPFVVSTEQRTPGQNLSPNEKLAPDPELVAGLSCLVVVCTDCIAGDLAAYLEYGNAVVERASDLSSAQEWIASRPAGRAIVVIDAGDATPLLDELVTTARAFPKSDIHFVVIGHGARRKPRAEGDNLVLVDANALTRWTLLKAVAIAAGRVQVQEHEALSGDSNVPLRQLSSGTQRRRGGRVLVAEDNEINQNVILHQLALLGYVADLTDDGREALARWQQGDHVMLLTDLQMPNMDGYDLTAAIRHAEGNDRHLPIIALTANALKSEELRCKAAGMDDYLTKPVLLDQLQVMLAKWLPISGRGEIADDMMEVLPTSTHFAVLDRAVLPQQIGNDPALIAKFFNDYQRSAHKAANEIRAAVALGDWKAAGNGAHKLKSSSRAVGALALGEICHQLEQAGKEGSADAVRVLAAEFEHALAAVMATIDQEEN